MALCHADHNPASVLVLTAVHRPLSVSPKSACKAKQKCSQPIRATNPLLKRIVQTDLGQGLAR